MKCYILLSLSIFFVILLPIFCSFRMSNGRIFRRKVYLLGGLLLILLSQFLPKF